MKKLFALLLGLQFCIFCTAQEKYFTKTGKISFDATVNSSLDNVYAVNKTVACVLDVKTGEIQFVVLMRGFEFAKALMMEHFNENYVESNKYPKANFKGTIANIASINLKVNATHTVKVVGKLTLHGETKDVETTGTITIKDGKINCAANFNIVASDYKISIPTVVADKVAKLVKIIVTCTLQPLTTK